jgi:hypothetical protein
MTAPESGRHRLFVCWALREPDDGEHVRELVDAIARQRDIPGVLSVEFGPRTTQVDWEGPDAAMTLTFDSFDAVRAYPPHAIHQALVATILRLGSDIRGFWFDR